MYGGGGILNHGSVLFFPVPFGQKQYFFNVKFRNFQRLSIMTNAVSKRVSFLNHDENTGTSH